MTESRGSLTKGLQESMNDIVTNVADIPEKYRKSFEEAGEVGVATKVICLSNIDIAANTFMADFNVNVAWKGEKDDEPEIQFYNAVEINEQEQAKTKKGDIGFDWFYRVRCRGEFRQAYKLAEFPFDVQELTVIVRLKSTCCLVHLPWGINGESSSCDPRCVMDEVQLIGAEVRPNYLPSYKFGKLAGYDPEAHVVFKVARQSDYWVSNYGLMTSILATFSMLAFALPVSDIGGRLGVGFTLNLTMVASYYLMQDKLPPVSYFTHLERHIVCCILFTFVMLLENALPAVLGEEFVAQIEKRFLMLAFGAWGVYHVFVYSIVIRKKAELLKQCHDGVEEDMSYFE